jgi:tetrahydromethanopterin S-methyltransferase subunit G
MPWMSVYGSVRQAIQDLVAPEIQKLHGEIKRLDGKLEGIDAKIEGLRGEMNARFDAVDRRFEGVDRRFESVGKRLESVEFSVKETIGVQIQSMDAKWREAMDVHERLASLEAKLDKR